MLQTRHAALRLSRFARSQTQRRFDSHKADDSHANHDAHHAAPKNESFGPGVYVMIGSIPLIYYIYSRSTADNSQHDSFVAKWIPDFKAELEKRNSLHTAAVEKAGMDRALFINAPIRQNVPLRNSEVFNNHSPYNRDTSQSVNLQGVIEHYQKQNAETAAKIAKKTPEQRFAES